MKRTLAIVLALAAGPTAAATAATSDGSYKGKIDYQGYEITFKVKGGKVSNIAARLLQDCDRNGFSETMTLAPSGSFPIRGGVVRAKTTDRYDQAAAHYELEIRFSGRTAKGFIREWDTVEGSGIVCDTLKRTFTARRG